MILSSKRLQWEYTLGEQIFTFPEDTGLPFIFDVEKELMLKIFAELTGKQPVQDKHYFKE